METTYTYSALDEARIEINLAGNYYEEKLEGLGEDFLSLVAIIQRDIVQFPEVGTKYKGSIRYRVLNHHFRHFPYSLYYDVHNQQITLIACWFQQRDRKALDQRIAIFRRKRNR